MKPLLWLAIFGCREPLTADVDRVVDDPSYAWGSLLGLVVSEDGYVNYDLLEENRGTLEQYVAWVSQDDLFDSERATSHHHAFWLNTYNALVMFQVLERGRPESVLDIGEWMPVDGAGFFLFTSFDVARNQLSLAEIRDEQIRWREMDYRSHAAMNSGMRSSPPMARELYTGPTLFTQLRQQMSRWVNDADRGVYVEGDLVMINPLFETYARDFDFFSGGLDLCTIAARHAAKPLADELRRLSEEGCPTQTYAFDSSLNEYP